MPYEIKSVVVLGLDDAQVNKELMQIPDDGEPWQLMGPPCVQVMTDDRSPQTRITCRMVYTFVRHKRWPEDMRRRLDAIDEEQRLAEQIIKDK